MRLQEMAEYPLEIERKWSVNEPPKLAKRKKVIIDQGYLAVSRRGTEVRLRRQNDKHFQTIKTGTGLQRGEIEVALSRKQFKSLWPATRGHRLEKVRYTLKWRGNKIELDVYQKELSGLVIAEVEFKSKKEAEAFSPPKWFGQEVTDDKSYKNVNLALRKKPD
jgi:adenylate cyclase